MGFDREFNIERQNNINDISENKELNDLSLNWLSKAQKLKYSYNFDWLGLPIIQYPQDIIAMQELIWSVKPDIIIETGIARGGSVIFYASMLELLSICYGHKGKVIAIDIDIREHNKMSIESHPLAKNVQMIEGSSIDPQIINQVKEIANKGNKVLACLDSNHTHEHVLQELHAYADLIDVGSYLVVFDTLIEDIDPASIGDRPWGKGNNPKTAVQEFLNKTSDFELDTKIQNKLQITVANGGFLKRIKY